MTHFPVAVSRDGDSYLAIFRDIPEAITGGSTREEAILMARDALITALDFYFEDKRKVPYPSKAEKGEVLIDLPVSLVAKVLLLNEMVEQRVRPAELASKLGATRQEVSRLTDLRYATKIDNVAIAMKALGKDLVLSVA